jgi:hypothetical protein
MGEGSGAGSGEGEEEERRERWKMEEMFVPTEEVVFRPQKHVWVESALIS